MVALLLDTDIGSDIDDAVALAYLLAHPECELAGITTVSGDTASREFRGRRRLLLRVLRPNDE